MQLPKAKNEINVNTVIQIVGFLIVIGGMGATWGSSQESIRVLTADVSDLKARITVVERAGVDASSAQGNMAFRITVLENANANFTKSVEELRTAVVNQSADIRVIRETVVRLDRANRGQ